MNLKRIIFLITIFVDFSYDFSKNGSYSMINGVLQDQNDIDFATKKLQSLGLKPHPIPYKCWDGLRMISLILAKAPKEAKILDVGCVGSPLLHWLSTLGFKNLFGCDLAPWWSWRNCLGMTAKLFLNPSIRFSRRNLEKTNYPSKTFDFITSLSVIEHGVNLENYFKEMSRLLKKGGILLTSTDYWPTPIDTSGIFPYGPKSAEMKIFDTSEILDLVELSKRYGFELIEPISLSAKEDIVSWMNKNYTFILFALVKKE